MPKIYSLNFVDQTTGLDTRVAGEITDDDWATLELFLRCAQRLAQEQELAHFSVDFSIKWDDQTGFAPAPALPPESQLALLLLRLRPFIHQGERTHVPKVCECLRRYLNHPTFHAFLARILVRFKCEESTRAIIIESNGRKLNTLSMLERFIDGFEFHPNLEKQNFFNSVSLPGLRSMYFTMLLHKADAALRLGMLVDILSTDGQRGVITA